MEQWKEYKLSDILSIVSGFAYKGEYLGKGESLLLGMGCVSYSELFLEKGMRPYAGEFPERYSVEAGDIVLATRQQSDNLPILGMPAIVPQKFKGKKMVFGANLYKVVPKSPEFPIDYIYWLLKTPAYIRHIRSCQTGTTVRMITKANIEDYAFMCPCKEQRNQISKLLWDIEMKIVLNRRINDNLEQQAQALFKAWFVDNAVIDDASVSDYFIPLRGKNLLTSDAKGGEVPVVAGGLTPSAYHNVANTKAPVITISASGANAGYVKLWGVPVWSADSSYIDSSVTPHIYFWYNLLKFSQKNIFDSQTGSAQPHIYPKHIGDIYIPNLDLDKVADYNKIVTPIYEQITNTQKLNMQLTVTRDTLLPKLMSGEIKI